MQRSCLGESPPPPRQLSPSPAPTERKRKEAERKRIQLLSEEFLSSRFRFLCGEGNLGAQTAWRG